MSATVPSDPFRPVKLATIDVERCPESIAGGPEYAALWALVRSGGRPRGMIRIPFGDGPLDGGQLSDAIRNLPAVSDDPAPTRRPGLALPFISVVIPSMFSRLEGLHACLRSLRACDYPDYEVIVVDNRPLAAPAVPLHGARVVREPTPGISAARNRGLAEARGEIVAFTDDDVEVDPAWLLALAVRFIDHPDEACVTGLALPAELATPAQVGLEEYYGGFGPRTYEPVSHRLRRPRGDGFFVEATVDAVGNDRQVRRSFSLYATGTFGLGANMAFRTAILRELGGFDLHLGTGTPCLGGEDLLAFAELAWRGHSLGFEPAAVVHHTHRRDDAALERQIRGYGLGYGALLMAMVMRDPRHVGRILATARRAITLMIAGYRAKTDPVRAEEHPRDRDLARRELRGMLVGPATYLLSRCRRRR